MARKGRSGVKRTNTRKFISSKVQGSGSFVSFYKPTWSEVREATSDLRSRSREFVDIRASDAKSRSAAKAGESVQKFEDALSEMLWELAEAKFHEWNWVDDEGEALPSLPDIAIGDLYGDEVNYLFGVLQKLYMLDEEEGGT
jgi:hypothetical protein